MKTKFIAILFLIITGILYLPALADSPLTSTKFYKAYIDIPEVKKAEGARLTEEIFDFLIDPEKPLDHKVAVINAMGWDIDGTSNGQSFIVFIAKKLKKEPKELKLKDLDTEQLLCLGYILALDDYFTLASARKNGGELETTDAFTLSEIAKEQKPRNFTVQMIYSLIKAQKLMESDWPGIYKEVNKVVNSDLTRNMRDEVVVIIMDYIKGYEEYVKKQTVLSSAVVIKPLKEVDGIVPLYGMSFSPDNNRMITYSGNEKTLNIWNVKTNQILTTINSGDFTDCRIFSPDGTWIILSDFTPEVVIYSAKDYSQIKKLPFTERICNIAINPTNPEIAFACFDGTVKIYSTYTWKEIKSFRAHGGYVSTVNFSSDGRSLLTGSYDRSVKLWDIRNKYSLIYENKDFQDGTFAYFMPKDKEILVRDFSGAVKVLDSSNGKVLWENQITGTLHNVAVNPGGDLIAGASETGAIYFWNWKKNITPLIFRAHDDQVLDVKFSFDGKELYTCSMDKTWKVWSVRILEKRLGDISSQK
ncbi:MAG TPA: WD40 repeat domain-containing protein [Candidatus Eremiobacteraeota bacterium]|nr:MAG: WD domain, G-beta repeat [bacterium ADurb.Bin363]HPZ08985.1 WD40 repeat domain-containing protein [Candidatus Eremiobacteraeota bacterium]